MANDSIKLFFVIGLIVAGLWIYSSGGFTTFGSFLGFFYDDYLIEDDFTIPSGSFGEPFSQNQYCTGICGDGNSYPSGQWDRCTAPARLIKWTCNDGKWETSGNSNYNPYGGYDNKAYISGGILHIDAGTHQSTTAKYLVNLKNRDVKLKINANEGASVSFGGQVIFSSTRGGCDAQASYLIELVKDVTNKDAFSILVNGDYVSSIIVPQETAYLEMTASYGERYCGKAFSRGNSMTVVYVKSRPYFSCTIDSNEVVVSDSFNEGSTFNIHSLTYEPTKFCPLDYPAIVRDFSAGGVKADTQGTITERLTRGVQFTVPTNQVYEIRYATLYKAEMGERCLLGQVYDTNLKGCIQKIFEQETVTTVIREKEYITVGKNQKVFTNRLSIGDDLIIAGFPSYTCGGQENVNAPYPRADCWSTSVSFRSHSYTLHPDESVDLNEYLNVKVAGISAHYHEECAPSGADCAWEVDDDASVQLILTVKNWNWLVATPTIGDILDYYVIKDSTREACFTIENKLGSTFQSEQAGYALKTTTDIMTMETRTIETKALPLGSTQYCIPIDSTRYGVIVYQINPFVKLGDEVFFDDEQVTYNYKIVDSIPKNETIIYQEPPVLNPTTPPIQASSSSFPVIPVVIGGLAILLFFVILKKL